MRYFFAAFFLIYMLINLWVGIRGWQAIGRYIPFLSREIYWAVFLLLAVSYFAGRFGREYLPEKAGLYLTVAGSYWLGFLIYFALALAVIELLRLAGRLAGILPASTGPLLPMVTGITVICMVTGIVAYGWINARNPRVSSYQVAIAKQAGDIKQLRVVVVSDLHLGTIVHNGRLVKMVDMIDELKPDLVLLPGDLVDENPGPFIEQDMMSTFRRLSPSYGMYSVPGNHDYYARRSGEIVKSLNEAGINVLRDQSVKIAESFYLVGRDDRSHRRFEGEAVPAAADPMLGTDKSMPVILMDHQPSRKGEDPDAGVDLKISGHTHRGQLFPFNLITGRMYEIDWGYYRRDSFQAIVSSGFGTWGPPLRIGSFPEIVQVDIRFGEEK